jgi:hypothetical protein
VEWNLEKLSQAFIPFLDESQVVQVTSELQNLGQSATMKLRQGRVLFMGGLDFAQFSHDLLVQYVLTVGIATRYGLDSLGIKSWCG